MELICGYCGHVLGLRPDEMSEYSRLIKLAEARQLTDKEFARFEELRIKKSKAPESKGD